MTIKTQQLPAGIEDDSPATTNKQPSLLLLIFAAGIYQIVLGLSIGLYGSDKSYIHLLCTIPLIIMAWGSLIVRSDVSRIVRVSSVLGILILLGQFATFASRPDMSNYKPASTTGWAILGAAWGLAGLLGVLSFTFNRYSKLMFFGSFAIFAGIAIYAISHSGRPKIDVWLFHQDSAAALLRGQNPYDITFENVYYEAGKLSKVYSPEIQQGNRVLFGYPYPPMSLWMYLPSYVLTGESRYAHGIAYGLCALGMGLIAGKRLGILAGTLFLTAPACWIVILNSWTEPFILLALVAVASCAIRCPKILPIALGVFFSMKQYNIIFLPLLLLILPRPILSKKTGKMLLLMLATMCIVTLPLALWKFSAFWNSTVTIQVKQPFRFDAFSFLSMIANAKDAEYEAMGKVFTPPGWWSAIAFVLMIPTWLLLLWKAPRNIGGFVLSVALTTIVFLFSNRQAFLNYHTFAAGSLLLAVATFEAISSKPKPQAAG